MGDEFYVCPNHAAGGGYDRSVSCGGWDDDDPDSDRQCTEAEDDERTDHGS